MKIVFGGTRGTSCVADRRFMRYGGDTTSVLVKGDGGDRIIIDAGTGLLRIAHLLVREKTTSSLTILMTHFHLDHIMGLPSFSPIYLAETDLTLVAARHGRVDARGIMDRLMKQPIWPVELSELRSRLRFLELDVRDGERVWAVGNMTVRACLVNHPGGSTAFRIEEHGRAFVFATDIEWRLMSDAQCQAFLSLCHDPAPADCLVMDGQYEQGDYDAHKGWGHSTWEDVLCVAERAGVRRVFVTHHSPHCDDRELTRREACMKKRMRQARFARDGMEVVL